MDSTCIKKASPFCGDFFFVSALFISGLYYGLNVVGSAVSVDQDNLTFLFIDCVENNIPPVGDQAGLRKSSKAKELPLKSGNFFAHLV